MNYKKFYETNIEVSFKNMRFSLTGLTQLITSSRFDKVFSSIFEFHLKFLSFLVFCWCL